MDANVINISAVIEHLKSHRNAILTHQNEHAEVKGQIKKIQDRRDAIAKQQQALREECTSLDADSADLSQRDRQLQDLLEADRAELKVRIVTTKHPLALTFLLEWLHQWPCELRESPRSDCSSDRSDGTIYVVVVSSRTAPDPSLG